MMNFEFDDDHHLYRDVMASMAPHSSMRAPPPRHWLAPGLAFMGGLTTLFGAEGQTKSVLAIDIACKLAAGLDWNGDPAEAIVDVVYIATERAHDVRRRVSAFCREHGIQPLANLVVYDGALDLSTESDHLAAIISGAGHLIDGEPAQFCVIDTLAASMSRPTSDTNATLAAARNLNRAARLTDAGIMVVHHSPLSGSRRISGGHLAAAMDIAAEVSKTRAGGKCVVKKDNGSPDSEWVNLTYNLKSVDVSCDNGTLDSQPVIVPCCSPENDTSKPPKLTHGRRQALNALSSIGGGTETAWRDAYKESAGDGKSPDAVKMSFKRSRDWLSENGFVARTDDIWTITEQEHLGEQHSD